LHRTIFCDFNSTVSNTPNQVTNTTACVDGYVSEWKDWCLKNTHECANLVVHGFFPGIVYNATTAPRNHYDGEYLTGTWKFINGTQAGRIKFYANSDFQRTVDGVKGPTGHIVKFDKNRMVWCEN